MKLLVYISLLALNLASCSIKKTSNNSIVESKTFEFLKEHPEILNNIYNIPINNCSYLKGEEKN